LDRHVPLKIRGLNTPHQTVQGLRAEAIVAHLANGTFFNTRDGAETYVGYVGGTQQPFCGCPCLEATPRPTRTPSASSLAITPGRPFMCEAPTFPAGSRARRTAKAESSTRRPAFLGTVS